MSRYYATEATVDTVVTGNVPEDNDFAKFTDANTVEGRSYAEVKTDLGLDYKTIYIPASAMVPTTTNGAAIGSNEYATNDNMFDYLAFDHTTQEHACFSFPMDEAWDRGTIKAKFFWTPATGCSAADVVVWGIEAGAISDDDALDADFDGSAQTVSDAVTAGVEADLHISAATGAITVSGTPALGDLIHFKVYRDADAGADTMDAEDAWLWGVWIQYQVSNVTASW